MADAARLHSHGLLKVPHECLVRGFRLAQKTSEKDVAASAGLVNELCRRLEAQSEEEARAIDWAKVEGNLDRVEERLRRTRKRIAAARKDAALLMETSAKRLRFCREANDEDLLHVLVADHLVRNGVGGLGRRLLAAPSWESRSGIQSTNSDHGTDINMSSKPNLADGSSTKTVSKAGLEYLVDDAVFAEAGAIAAGLRERRDAEPALAWCQENRSRLRRVGSSLEFSLRKACFLEIVQAGRSIEAVGYARKHLAAFAQDHLEEVQKAVAALALPRAPEQRPPQVQQLKTRACEGETEGPTQGAKKRRTDEHRDQQHRQHIQSENQQLQTQMRKLKKGSEAPPRKTPCTFPGLTEKDWDALARQFAQDSIRALSLEQQTTMQVAVKAGLASLRTALCSDSFATRFMGHKRHWSGEESERLGLHEGKTGDSKRYRSERQGVDNRSSSSETSSRNESRTSYYTAPSDIEQMDTEPQAAPGWLNRPPIVPEIHLQQRITPQSYRLGSESPVSQENVPNGNGNQGSGSFNRSSDSGALLDPVELKTAACRVLNCPCCDPLLGRVAEMLPLKQQMHSSLVCRISGKVMTQDNPPYALPNGQVYSYDALHEMAKNSGVYSVTCPVTGKLYNFDELKRVYLT